MKKLIIAGAVCFLFAACVSYNKSDSTDGGSESSEQRPPHDPAEFRVLKQDIYGGREKEERLVISDQETLKALFGELGLEQVPHVNFVKYKVVALFMGQQRTGGYSIGINQVRTDRDTTYVFVDLKYPGRKGIVIGTDSTGTETIEQKDDTMVTMALTAPYCIAVIPKTKAVEYVFSN